MPLLGNSQSAPLPTAQQPRGLFGGIADKLLNGPPPGQALHGLAPDAGTHPGSFAGARLTPDKLRSMPQAVAQRRAKMLYAIGVRRSDNMELNQELQTLGTNPPVTPLRNAAALLGAGYAISNLAGK